MPRFESADEGRCDGISTVKLFQDFEGNIAFAEQWILKHGARGPNPTVELNKSTRGGSYNGVAFWCNVDGVRYGAVVDCNQSYQGFVRELGIRLEQFTTPFVWSSGYQQAKEGGF